MGKKPRIWPREYPSPGQPWPTPRGAPGPMLPPEPWLPPDWRAQQQSPQDAQRDRITQAMIGPDGVPQDYGNSELPPELMPPGAPGAPGDMPPPMPQPPHHPRNLLDRGAAGPMSQEWMDKMMQRGMGGGGAGALSPETKRIIDQALNGPFEYNEWENVPQKNPRLGEEETRPPLPPEVIPPDAPEWATEQQGTPEFIEYPKIWGKYRDT